MVKINSLILSLNEYSLADILNLSTQIYSKTNYKKYFYEFCKKKNTELQNDLLKWMKEKFIEEPNFEKCQKSNIVYIYTYKNKMVYIGKTTIPYQDRLFGGYNNLFGQFCDKCNFSSKNKDWKFFTYSSRTNNIDSIEAFLINWFTSHGYPTLNEKCENPKALYKMIKGKNEK